MADYFSADWLGVHEVMAAIDKLAVKGEEAARESIAAAAAIVENEIKGNFSGSHSRGQPHVGGDKPNIVSGTLRRSLHADPITRVAKGEYVTFVGPREVYGRRVELGYQGSRGFPYVKPGFETAKPKIAAAQTVIIKKHLG